MKRFNITVNGKAYDVAVEEVTDGSAPAMISAPASAPKVASAPAPATVTPAGEGEKVTAPMPGTILDVKVSVGDSVTKGQALMILEAMKMENEIVAPCDGKVTSVTVKKGDSVNSADTLATVQ
ncbi:MAG: biotin/lipoyl-binding protein [Ruminococcus sp.]|nr:biotin/lipoyl-binding protein [Ruminococcus sp.]